MFTETEMFRTFVVRRLVTRFRAKIMCAASKQKSENRNTAFLQDIGTNPSDTDSVGTNLRD